LDFGFWILDFGFWILDFGFWILDFGLGTLFESVGLDAREIFDVKQIIQ
jgi:hypothetical protein